MQNERDKLILSHMEIVHKAASTAISEYGLNDQALEDIRSAATIDLIEAANSFVVTSSMDFSGVEFTTYAWNAVVGAAMDAAKKLSWHVTITKGQQTKINDGEYPLVFMREISNEFPDDKNKPSDKPILAQQIIQELFKGNNFSDKEKYVLTQRFVLDRPQLEVMRILGCSRKTIRNIQKSVLQRLKVKMS